MNKLYVEIQCDTTREVGKMITELEILAAKYPNMVFIVSENSPQVVVNGDLNTREFVGRDKNTVIVQDTIVGTVNGNRKYVAIGKNIVINS